MKAIMSTDSRHVHNTPAYACLHPSVCTGNSHKIRMHNAHSKYTHTYTTHAGQMFTLPMQKVIFSGFYLWGNQIPGSRSPRATSRMYSRLRTSQGHESPTHSPGDEHQQGGPQAGLCCCLEICLHLSDCFSCSLLKKPSPET